MKKLACVIAGLLLTGVCATSVLADDAVHLTFAHAMPQEESLFGYNSDEFKRIVEEKSEGSIVIDIFPSGQLGTIAEYVSNIQNGTLDFAFAASSFVSNYCPEVTVFDLPFLFEDYDHVWETLDGEVGEMLNQKLEENGLLCPIWFGLGFRQVTTSDKHPIETIEDFKGFRIRTMPSTIYQELFAALGADAVPMDVGELYTALQQGTVDGQENPYNQIRSYGFQEVTPIIVKTEHSFSPCLFLMSPNVQTKLTEDQMAIINEAIEECKGYFRDKTIEIEERDKDAILADGSCTLVESIEKKDLQDATASVYEKFPEYDEMVQIIRGLRE